MKPFIGLALATILVGSAVVFVVGYEYQQGRELFARQSSAAAFPRATSLPVQVPTPRPQPTADASLIQLRWAAQGDQKVPAGDSIFAFEQVLFGGGDPSFLFVSQHAVWLPPGSLGYLIDRNASRTAAYVQVISTNQGYSGKWYVPKETVRAP